VKPAAAKKSRHKSRLQSRNGVALIEAALLMPVLLLLILNIVNLGIYIFAWVTVNDAARAAAEYSAYNGTAVNLAAQPAFAQIQALANNDVSSLPNYAASTNPTLQVCSNTNGTLSCSGTCTGTCSTPADPEPTLYTVNYVDVAYSFTPVFSAFSIPALGISLTIPPTVIHRQAAMRRMH
jgi:Flp pilus assembly protein TadG